MLKKSMLLLFLIGSTGLLCTDNTHKELNIPVDTAAKTDLLTNSCPSYTYDTLLMAGGCYLMYQYGSYILRDLHIAISSSYPEKHWDARQSIRFLKYIPTNLAKLCVITGLTYNMAKASNLFEQFLGRKQTPSGLKSKPTSATTLTPS